MTIVDRPYKFLLMARVPQRRSDTVSAAVVSLHASVGNTCHTIAFDNGREFANHRLISYATGAAVYFAAPYHSWERGLNEHTKGLVRGLLTRSPIPDPRPAIRVGGCQCNWRIAGRNGEAST